MICLHLINMLVANIVTFAPLDEACPQARNENSLGLFCHAGDTAAPPQTQPLHV